MDTVKFNMVKMRFRFIKRNEIIFQREIIRDLDKIKVVQPIGEMVTRGVLLQHSVMNSHPADPFLTPVRI